MIPFKYKRDSERYNGQRLLMEFGIANFLNKRKNIITIEIFSVDHCCFRKERIQSEHSRRSLVALVSSY